MLIKDIIKMSILNAFRGRTRTVLTALSITIGVASVLLVTSIGTSGEKVISGELEKLGLQGIAVFQNLDEKTVPLYPEDAELLQKRFKDITIALPVVMEYGTLALNRISTNAVILGIGARADEVYNVSVLHGRMPNEVDIRSSRKVAVIDDELAKKSYKRTNVVGKEIVVNLDDKSEKYEIIGVIKSQKDGINQLLGGSIPDFVYIPYTTVNKLRGSEELSQIAIKCSGDNAENGEKFAAFLSKKNGLNNGYLSENVATKMGEIKDITGLVSLLISAIAAISLCVAGLGIMNTMFSSTAERYREIGICMAVGARSRDIALCFLTESIIIALIGGTVGAVLGLSAALSITNMLGIGSVLNITTFLSAELLSIFCGAIFSVVPAIKASRLDPIITLRSNG